MQTGHLKKYPKVVNVNALANALKIAAVPGESLSVKILHSGKETGQGVSYLDDGTMVVVQNGAVDIGKRITVVIARVIQTDAGKILFAKKI
ncbi:MAG: PilT protein domain protein [Microgenomates group bacterium GW2011_GWA2_47_8]|nr:MAG: PilT protein domain protein [Microgenomates group bacterium GW2011_GWA2_47_8]